MLGYIICVQDIQEVAYFDFQNDGLAREWLASKGWPRHRTFRGVRLSEELFKSRVHDVYLQVNPGCVY